MKNLWKFFAATATLLGAAAGASAAPAEAASNRVRSFMDFPPRPFGFDAARRCASSGFWAQGIHNKKLIFGQFGPRPAFFRASGPGLIQIRPFG